MSSSPLPRLLLLWALPAALGMAAAWRMESPAATVAVLPGQTADEPLASSSSRSGNSAALLKPGDDEAIRYAAMTGRTAEAKQRFRDTLADPGSHEFELASWLAPILIGEPTWLMEGLQPFTGDFRKAVLSRTFLRLAEIDPPALEMLVRRYPTREIKHGFGASYGANMSHPADELEVMLDPALNFDRDDLSDHETGRLFNQEHIERLIEREREGPILLPGRFGTVLELWPQLREVNPAAADRLRKTFSEDMAAEADEVDLELDFDRPGPVRQVTAEELALMDEVQCALLLKKMIRAGRPPSPQIVAALPEDIRITAIQTMLDTVGRTQADLIPGLLSQISEADLNKNVSCGFGRLPGLLNLCKEAAGTGDHALRQIPVLFDEEERQGAVLDVLSDAAPDAPNWVLAHLDLIENEDDRQAIRTKAEEAVPEP